MAAGGEDAGAGAAAVGGAAAQLAPAAPELIEDDGTLLLARTATDNASLHTFVDLLEEQIPKANSALQFAHLLTSEQGKVAFSDPSQRARFAKQSQRDLLAILEAVQKQVEKSDNIDTSKLPSEVRMARKALVRFAQTAQETLERSKESVAALLRILGSDIDTNSEKAKATKEVPLHEKYKHMFEKKPEDSDVGGVVDGKKAEEDKGASAGADADASEFKPITVKYQGRGERPPPSDNLYVKGLPGFVVEGDLEAMFAQVGEIQSLKLKTAEWGAIAFVRMANRAEAGRAIERFHETVPEQLRKALDRHKAKQRGGVGVSATGAGAGADGGPSPRAAGEAPPPDFDSALAKSTEEGKRTLQRLTFARMDLSQPLGIVFDDQCLAREVTPDSQASRLGLTPGASLKALGGKAITKGTEQLKKRIGRAKKHGLKEVVIGYSPAPLHALFTSRPFGFAIRLDEILGLFVIGDAEGQSKELGVARGMALVAINGEELLGLTLDECFQCLKEASLPARLVFRVIPKGAEEVVSAQERAVVLSSDDEDGRGQAISRKRPVAQEALARFRVDLSQPLGIFFDKECGIDRLGPGSQAEILGLPAGARARELGGERIQPPTTEELVKRVGAAKKAGLQELLMTFSLPSGEASPTGIVAVFDVNLSSPLGIFFDKACGAERIGEGSQAETLGVPAGARALRIEGEPVLRGATEELVKRVGSAKKAGVKTIKMTFELPSQEPASSDDAKRAKSGSGSAAAAASPMAPAPAPAPACAPAAAAAANAAPAPLVLFRMDLSKPLGIFFDKECVADRIGESTQAAELGIPAGSEVLEIDGEAIPRQTEELVKRVGAAKKAGAGSLALGVVLPPNSSAAAPQALREFRMDLSKPLGIFFDKACVAERIGEGTQAEALGIPPGAQVLELDRSPLAEPPTTEALVGRVGALKRAGAASLVLGVRLAASALAPASAAASTSAPPSSSSSSAPEPPAKRSRTASRDADPPRATKEGVQLLERLVSYKVDLSRPLGVFFDKECNAERIGENSQASELGILPGSKVKELAGQAVPNRTEELVKRIGAAKKEGQKELVLGATLPVLSVDFDDRPLPFSVALDPARGVFVVQEVMAEGEAAKGVIAASMALTAVGDGGAASLVGRCEAEVERLLAEAPLPVRLTFRWLPPGSAGS